LPINFTMAAITGFFWYGQFFFYNLGHVRMGHYEFTSWAIHMIMLVLFSNLVGVLLREWRRCRLTTDLTIVAALIVLSASVVLLTFGNYIGDKPKSEKETHETIRNGDRPQARPD
jgi:L-rhamnose-H+ transport protein